MDKHLFGRDVSFQSTTKNGDPDDLRMFPPENIRRLAGSILTLSFSETI
jgi:hypothetical protein